MRRFIIIAMILILLPTMPTITTAENVRAAALPPSAPKNLTASGTYGYVILEWNASIAPSQHPVEKYNIYRGTSSGNETIYHTLDASYTSYTDYNVVVGKTYYYYVTAVNDVGESNKSNEVHVTVQKISKPTPPQDFKAEWNETEVRLDWSNPSYNGGSPIKFYKIYRNGAYLTNTTVTTYVDKNINYTKTYTYYVTAVNSDGLESNPSNQVKVEWGKPGPPKNLQAEKNGGYVVLTWQQPDYTGYLKIKEYRIYIQENGGWKLVGSTKNTMFQIQTSSLPSGNVKIKVTAVNDLGEGAEAEVTVSNPSTNILPYVILGVGIAAVIFAIYVLMRRKKKNERKNSRDNQGNQK